jgi:benzylsuccinate CoA-transferase BbsF subunit
MTALQAVPMRSLLLPFRGLRIADFSWVIAAPLATQYFAIHGADVIRIESRGRPEVLRGAPPFPTADTGPDGTAYFPNFNQGKRGITLNLRDRRAIALARRLVATCDVVSENFTPGTMAKLGLGYEDLRAIRPDLIMLSMSLAGQTGPDRGHKGFGTVIQGSAGITHLTGWPDRDPAGTGVAYTDFFSAHVAAFALLTALEHRRRTGEGQHIDLSQQEAPIEGLDAALLAATANGEDTIRAGNRHPSAAPHGAYPCRGNDERGTMNDEVVDEAVHRSSFSIHHSDSWVAIAVMTDEHWRGLIAAIGSPDWARDRRFRTLLGRKAHEEELDRLLGGWTVRYTAREVERLLAARGVPVAVVANARDLHEDAQLLHRQHYVDSRHPVIGGFPLDALAYRIDGLRPDAPRHPALLGGDNEPVYRELLGLSDEEYRELEADGVLR